MIDSGASMVAMSQSDAEPLLKRGLIGPGDYRREQLFETANGTMVTAKVYDLHLVKVGNREIDDVPVSIYPGNGPRLLGQTFLKRFKSWSIDNGRRVLMLNE
jgi:clan AA aspartic protease (TIGR02281 family)